MWGRGLFVSLSHGRSETHWSGHHIDLGGCQCLSHLYKMSDRNRSHRGYRGTQHLDACRLCPGALLTRCPPGHAIQASRRCQDLSRGPPCFAPLCLPLGPTLAPRISNTLLPSTLLQLRTTQPLRSRSLPLHLCKNPCSSASPRSRDRSTGSLFASSEWERR